MAGCIQFSLQLALLLVVGLRSLEASVNIPDLAQVYGNDLKVEPSDGLNAKINEIFDDVMPVVKDLIIKNGLDPLKMDDIEKQLNGILGTKGVLNLSKGWMQGLSGLKRSGDVILSYENKIVTLEAQLGLDLIDVAYDYHFKYWFASRSGALNARLSGTQLRLVLKVDLEHYRIGLESFQVTSVRKMEVKLQGGVVDKVLSAAINAFIGSFRKQVIETVEKRGSIVMRQYMEKINEKIPRPDGTPLMGLEDSSMFSSSNAFDNSEMVDNIPTFIEYVTVE
ncbi:uncharacterized protein LOC143365763 [Halictus rubicundus]|uniref:uncharacterized protein LOC143365763 n=1 Tax=Halictus rubicundus TaxID=77578 RepID=UPI004036CF95